MALLSPGIQVTETDLSLVSQNAGTTNAAFAGRFNKGYAGKAVLINNVSELIDNFGKPDNLNFNQWFQAYYFLQYSNGLYISRAVNSDGYWVKDDNMVRECNEPGKVEITGTPDNLAIGTIVKFGENALREFKIRDIELPTEGVKAKGKLIVISPSENAYEIKINGENLTYVPDVEGIDAITIGLARAITTNTEYKASSNLNEIIIEAQEVGTPMEVEVLTTDLLEYFEMAKPAPFETYELVFDGEDDFNIHCNPGDILYIKRFSTNAFVFAPNVVDNKLSAKEMRPYSDLYENEDVFDVKSDSIAFPEGQSLKFMARGFGNYGNDIQIVIAREADFDDLDSQALPGVPLLNIFEYKPRESNKEIGLMIAQNDVILEKYIVSLNPTARDFQNKSIFIEDVIRRKSSLIYAKVGNGGLPASCIGKNYLQLSNGEDGEIGPNQIKAAYGSVGESILFGDVELLPIDYVISNEECRLAASELASARQDCLAIQGATYDIVGLKTTDIVGILLDDVNFGELNSGSSRNSYSTYVGNYAMIYDSYNDCNRWISMAGMVAGARAKTSSDLQPWYAAAGEKQGQLIGVVKLAFSPNVGARDKLYTSQINPIVSFPGKGIQIYGQKTLQSSNTAFSRVNVRLLFNYIKRNLTETMRSFTFELNDEFTRNRAQAIISAFLQRVKVLRGIYDYGVQCDENNNPAQVVDNNELICDVAIKPTRVSEFIYLNLFCLGSDVDISEVLGKS